MMPPQRIAVPVAAPVNTTDILINEGEPSGVERIAIESNDLEAAKICDRLPWNGTGMADEELWFEISLKTRTAVLAARFF